MKSKSATLEDVARHAGVSYQTVSRVLNKSANVSEATRRKVEKSIELLRYVQTAWRSSWWASKARPSVW
jgi:DNA-binding LacI/PurR family transcriptional regulator